MSNNTGGPAFPGPYMNDEGYMEVLAKQQGMTLRDYFAAKALQGLMGRVWGDDIPAEELFKIWAASAYAVADAMIKQREASK